jgi:hypothetical protein
LQDGIKVRCPRIGETDREAILRACRGEDILKQRVMLIEKRRRIKGADNSVHLVAGHCKPWRDSTNGERLDGENGLLLTPSIDHLFNRGQARTLVYVQPERNIPIPKGCEILTTQEGDDLKLERRTTCE